MIYPDVPRVGYLELAAILRDDILNGQIAPGARVPSETTLSQTYGISVKTVRRAVQVLRGEGLAVVSPGVGVFVAGEPEREDLVVEEGTAVVSRPATARERERFGLPYGWSVLHIQHPDGTGDVVSAYRTRVVFRGRG